jgi:hypothetical protein
MSGLVIIRDMLNLQNESTHLVLLLNWFNEGDVWKVAESWKTIVNVIGK